MKPHLSFPSLLRSTKIGLEYVCYLLDVVRTLRLYELYDSTTLLNEGLHTT